MANQEHVDILRQGVDVWNKWREEHSDITPNLSGAYLGGTKLIGVHLERAYLTDADLRHVDLTDADLRWADLGRTHLYRTCLRQADLRWASLWKAYMNKTDLTKANLIEANLKLANLTEANLAGANLAGANLNRADLEGANLEGSVLKGASLMRASLIRTNFTNANLTECNIFGISVWNVNVKGAVQKDLIITRYNEPTITVDNLKIAQFIYLLLHNEEIREVIDTITSKVVLILGRFTPKRKPVLDALRDELRNHNYSPVVFDFEPSTSRNLTETVSLLANMSRFVIADLTDAKSIPQELQAIVPHLPSVPIQPIIYTDDTEYAMFEHYERYPWVLPIYRYQDTSSLIASFKEHILGSVEQKEREKDKTKVLEEENRKLKERIKELEGKKVI